MEIRELFYYKTIVDEGSILKASKRLHISQPPLSRTIKNLEDELNTTLFIRGRKLILTPSGKLLYDKAISILNLSSDTLAEIADLENGANATLQLGIVSSSTSLLYKEAIKEYNKKLPHIKFNIQEANTYQLIEQLNKHLIDIAVVRTPFDFESFNGIFFKKEKMIVLTKNKLDTIQINIEDLDGKPLIIYRRFKEIIQGIFNEKHIRLNIICELDDAKSAILFSTTGIGYAIVPESAYNLFSYLSLNKAILNEERLETNLGVISRKKEVLLPAYQEFINILQKTNQK